MTDLLLWLSLLPLIAGTFFCVAGAIGLLRFPDIFCRLHAVTKADTLGLGLIILGLIIRQPEWHSAGMMLLIWLLVMASGATACQLLARYEREHDREQEHDGERP